MEQDEIALFYPATTAEWRDWLVENHATKKGVWVVMYKKSSQKPSITWSEAVDEALCFGWIDSTKKKMGEDACCQFFGRRRPTSTWSKVNKTKVAQLLAQNLMTEAGLKSIEVAKENGSWIILDEVEELIVPTDLQVELNANPLVKQCYEKWSKSMKKVVLQRLVMAKRPETRTKRIQEIIQLALKEKSLITLDS